MQSQTVLFSRQLIAARAMRSVLCYHSKRKLKLYLELFVHGLANAHVLAIMSIAHVSEIV
jgi:hypothetical protein